MVDKIERIIREQNIIEKLNKRNTRYYKFKSGVWSFNVIGEFGRYFIQFTREEFGSVFYIDVSFVLDYSNNLIESYIIDKNIQLANQDHKQEIKISQAMNLYEFDLIHKLISKLSLSIPVFSKKCSSCVHQEFHRKSIKGVICKCKYYDLNEHNVMYENNEMMVCPQYLHQDQKEDILKNLPIVQEALNLFDEKIVKIKSS